MVVQVGEDPFERKGRRAACKERGRNAAVGVRVDRAGDLAEAVSTGVKANKPYLIDVDIAADINPAGAGVWELPGLGQSKPSIGTRYQPT